MATSAMHLRLSLAFVGSLILFGSHLPSALAQTGEWQSHTSFNDVGTVAFAPDRLWAGTTGGLFSVDRTTGEIERFTIVDGLHAVTSQAMAYDERRNLVWLGYVDGVLDRVDPETGAIVSFRDIARADQFSSRGINRLVVSGDSLLVATDFGVVVFDPIQDEVRDSYTRLGTLSPATRVNDITLDVDGLARRLWVATDEGLAVANADAVNLQDPVSWTVESVNGLTATAVAHFNDSLYVGTDQGLFVRRDSSVFADTGVSALAIGQLVESPDALFGVDDFRVFGIFANGTGSFVSSSFQNPQSVDIDDAELIVGDAVVGMVSASVPAQGTSSLSVSGVFIPDGPSVGIFTDLAIGPSGTLLAGGSASASSGFFSLTPDGAWTSYTGPLVPELSGNSRFTRVHEDASGGIWATSEGGGVAYVSPEGAIELFDDSNSSLLSVTGFPGFIIAAGVTSDRDGNIWVTTRGSTQPIHIRTPDGQWQGRGPLIGDGLAANSTAFDRIYSDSFGQKWIIVRDPTAFNVPIGIIVLEDSGTPLDSADDEFRYFRDRGSAGQGLPSNRVTSVAEDKNGLLWVGTEEGPAYFVNTGIVARDQFATPIWPQRLDRTESVFLYFGLPINDIAVDPANRIWFATNEGVRIATEREGGYVELAHLTTANSPLPSNVIVAIAVRESSGEVFIATESGMVSTQTDAIAAAVSPADLNVFPNPFKVTDGFVGHVTIDGLVDETVLRIASIDGRVVRTLNTRGGRIQWDGLDESGKTVPSGMYLIVAVSERGEGTAFGKVAVIN